MISTIAIVTRDRPMTLKRALQSYISNAVQYQRDVRFLVLDGSEDAAKRNENKVEATKIAYENRVVVYYLGAREAENFVTLIKRASIPPDAIRFSVEGEVGVSSKGAQRNLAFLACAGEQFLCVDDSTKALVVDPAGQELSKVVFSSGNLRDPHTMWFRESKAVALLEGLFKTTDVVGAMERFLGKRVEDIRTELTGQWEGKEPTTGTVAFVQGGVAGDVGLEWPGFSLIRGGLTSTRLLDPGAYSYAKTSRGALRVTRQPKIGTWGFILPAVLGVDASELSAPSIPVGRSPDYLGGGDLLGALIRFGTPGRLVGFEPVAFYHNPPNSNSFPQGAVTRASSSLCFQDVLLQAMGIGVNSTAPLGLTGMAARLKKIGSLGPGEFSAWVHKAAHTHREELFEKVLIARRTLRGMPQEWASDVDEILDLCKTARGNAEYHIPSDLKEGRTDSEAILLAQELIQKCSDLLHHWPGIVRAAKELRSQGKELAVKL